jgi:predicted secreted protein
MSGVGKLGFGALFKYETTAGGGTYTKALGVTKIGPYQLKADDVDISDHDSPSQYREFVAGMLESGGVNVDLNYSADETTHQDLEAAVGVQRSFKVSFRHATGRVATFSGYVNGVSPELPFDNKMTCTVSVKISGKPTWAAT